MKSDKRKRARAKKHAEKAAAMSAPGGVSKYGKKQAEQRNGHYRKTSPFYQA